MARPTTPLLSREAIVAAALETIDVDGVDGLSMRRLAARLGVSGPSLYHHVESKDEILDAIVEHINSRIRLDEAGPGWETALTSYAHQLRGLLVQHPHVIEFLALRPVTTHAGLRIYEHLIGLLDACGWGVRTGRDIALAVEDLVYGAALMANTPEIELDADGRSRYPALARIPAEGLNEAPDDGFELGFAAFMDGLRRRAAESGGRITPAPRPRQQRPAAPPSTG